MPDMRAMSDLLRLAGDVADRLTIDHGMTEDEYDEAEDAIYQALKIAYALGERRVLRDWKDHLPTLPFPLI